MTIHHLEYIMTVTNLMLLCYLLLGLLVRFTTSNPFILNEIPKQCIFNSNTSLPSMLEQMETDAIVIYYTFCESIHSYFHCGAKVTACLKSKQDNSTRIIGREFILDANNNLILDETSSGFCEANTKKKYKFTIKFFCDEEMKEHLEVKNQCEYVIHKLKPDCIIRCTAKIYGLLVDLRPLKKNFQVHSADRNFSLTLCDSNERCSNSEPYISSCETTNNITVPLSNYQNEITDYRQEENELIIHGSYKGEKKQDEKKFELILKCDWDNPSGKITYKKVQTQGKHYKFEMETLYGCIKLPPYCMISDSFYIYNLTRLYNNRGYIEVTNVPRGKIYLNVCGPLNLRGANNACSSTHSQVCEVNGETYINRGSIFSGLKINDDMITATFTNGVRCSENNVTDKYRTHINFICSENDERPVFFKNSSCDTFLNWHTPLACPLFDEGSCKYIPQEYQNCTIDYQGYIYDLSPLTLKNESYGVQDATNKSIKYFLNVCGPALDSGAPCMKDSMVLMKDMLQNNLKYKVKSLGKMDKMYVANEQVIIETLSGTFCGGTEGGDYRSSVQFICSDKEEEPQLVHKTECTFKFLWKTRYACPNKQLNKCVYKDSTNSLSLDFTKLKQTRSVRFNHTNTYRFDFCSDNYTECSKEKCSYLPVQRKLSIYDDRHYINFSLPKKCISETDITTVSFELVCDTLVNNEHFTFLDVDNCTIRMQLNTNLICSGQDVSLEKIKYDIINEQMEKKDCFISNPVTGYKFYLSDLQINVPYLECPKAIFDNENSSVMLIYVNGSYGNHCEEPNGFGTYVYKVLLKCSKVELNQTEQTSCSKTYKFKNLEYCKLFNSSERHSTGNKTGVIIGSIFGGLAFIMICAGVLFKLRKRIVRISSYDSIYEKDGDL